ncbi:predicted protein [Histoplasma capsulatum H143]|uniref:NADP-dependent oxidoreductase domain-containing protein n=1 Tax=Ajellomyces capsulatus (strain H143) TaxID=544712 RepID=C6HJ18_AJECH|nr:predicted protein [Histoplasma capsulatum H143]
MALLSLVWNLVLLPNEGTKGESYAATLHALGTGYRHLDCARFYLNEDEVGQAIYDFLRENNNVKRSDIFVGRIESNFEEIKLTDEQFEAMNSGRRKACAVCVNMKDTLGMMHFLFVILIEHYRESG